VPRATFGADLPQRPGDYGIQSTDGMTALVRAPSEADERVARSASASADDEEEIRSFNALMPADALRIRGTVTMP
jgi:UDP-N-acetylmuramoylalanine--D-glutamate ligase